MKAVILAGGDGKRLRPITCTMPKPMVPLLNKPTVFYTLDLLKTHGITDVVITLGYMGEAIRTAVGDGSAWGLNVTYSDPVKRLGTAGSVYYAAPEYDDTILVLSGDGITDIDLTALVKAHQKSASDVTVALYRVAEPYEYGIALTDSAGYITRFIEKPSHGEVFSDYANTGIYVIEPSAMQHIPPDIPFDFSKDLFPLLQSKQRRLYGWQFNSYWCDIGDITQYLAAQRDMLEGKCSFISNAKRYGNMFIEPNAVISASAKLFSPCYIGSNAEIGDAVCIEPYSVIGSGVKLLSDCNVKRSVILNNAVIRTNVELRGAVICERAELNNNSVALEGSVLGAASHVGSGAIIAPQVLIWPNKTIEPQSKCNSNVVWGEQRRITADEDFFMGYGDTELTPEAALRIAAAYASKFSSPSSLCVGSDGSACAVMLKQSAISGALSQGADVISVDASSRSAFGYTIKMTGASGGVYIDSHAASRTIKLHIYGGNGVEADSDTIRAIERGFLFGEQQPITSNEIGLMRSYSGANQLYEARMIHLINASSLINAPRKLIIAANGHIADIVARVILKLGWQVDIAENAKKVLTIRDSSTISILCDEQEQVTVCLRPGENDVFIDYHSLLCIASIDNSIERAVLPTDIAEPLLQHIRGNNRLPVLSSVKPSRRRLYAAREGLYCESLLEPEALIIKLCELFAKGNLFNMYKSLPLYHSRESRIPVQRKEFGRILREIVESENAAVADMVDGVRLKHDTGWVNVRPHSESSSFKVLASSMDAEYARELCDIYLEKLKRLRRNK